MGYQDIIRELESAQLKTNIPSFAIGDTVKVAVQIVEGDKKRVQSFSGIVMGKKGRGIGETFRVYRNQNGQIVERIFPINSPSLTKIEVIRRGKVRRAKLYYLRDATGKAARIQEKMGTSKKNAPKVETHSE